ncbi:CFEM domain-containing protein [Rhizoctonia solani AG-1 IA]|uniref:CFEM domain-containing protein n=1 Tax=Thanatephorus cucumeris (strain AG1-IA) TaxID=983506 RepID=L8WQ51_THACA|nr:CFEM domain-containing protein [Rhizoctonia solani AG-1 IA]
MRSFGLCFFFSLVVILSCLGKADPGSCSLEDNKCLCSYKPFVEGTYACFKSSCTTPDDLKAAYDMSSAMCRQAHPTGYHGSYRSPSEAHINSYTASVPDCRWKSLNHEGHRICNSKSVTHLVTLGLCFRPGVFYSSARAEVLSFTLLSFPC